MDNFSPEQEQLNQLSQQLSETIVAEQFFQTETGRLWTQFATAEITRLVNEISSDKYIKDHAGYVQANTELRVWKKMLRKMQIAGSPVRRRKIEERLEEADGRE